MLKRFLLVLFCCVLPLTAEAASKTILVMGDSLSAAYRLDVSQGWVALLKARLTAEGYDYTVVNASVSGETSGGGITRLPQALDAAHPAIVILELGANDGLQGDSVKTLQDNLGRMIELSTARGAKVLLVGILLPPNYGPQYTGAFQAVFPALAKKYAVPLLPFLLAGVADHRDLLQDDGMHPKAAGEPKVLDNVWPYLKPLLSK